ncbi:MAG: hypothetical protein K9G62_05430 [Alphaproteobacteria bacterium]|nr:hypothetical protein [Alphaproteobacteria bacterium]
MTLKPFDKFTKEEEWGRAYATGFVSGEQARKEVAGFEPEGQLAFQTSFFKVAGPHIGNVDKIPQALAPFQGILKREAVEVLAGRVNTVDTGTNTAWSVLNNVFNDDIRAYEPLKRTKLQNSGVTVVEHAKFDFTIYETPGGHMGVQIVPDDSGMRNDL